MSLDRRFERIKHIILTFPSHGTWRIPADPFIQLVLKKNGIEDTEHRRELFLRNNLILKETLRQRFTWEEVCHLAEPLPNSDCSHIQKEWGDMQIEIETEVLGFTKYAK